MTNVVALFEVLPPPPPPETYFRITSVELYDTNNVAKTVFEKGEPIRAVIGYETDDTLSQVTFRGRKENGDVFVTKEMTIGDGVLTHSDVSDGVYVGVADIAITAQGDGGIYTTNIVAAYTIEEPAAPPVEETEEVPWSFTSITVADGTATLTWAIPTASLPSDGSDLTFRVGYRASLTAGDWNWTVVPANDISVAQGSASGSVEINVAAAPFSASNSAFFKLLWTNKVKE